MNKQKINSIEELDEFFEEQKETLELKIFDQYEISRKGLDLVEYLTKNFDKLSDNVKNIILDIPYEKIPKEKFLPLLNLYEKTLERKIDLSVCVLKEVTFDIFDDKSQNVFWDFQTILKANKDIDRICDFLKQSTLTPFEMLAFIHDYVSTIVAYNCSKEEKRTWASKNQFFAGAYLDIPDFVCAGYSALMEEIIDNLNIPQLKCKILSINFDIREENLHESHARCLINIKDEKYGLDQAVFDDPTWDNNKNLNHEYANFAMPNDSLEQKLNKRFTYYIPSSKEFRQTKSKYEFDADFNLSTSNYNRSKNQISQEMIEECYFNMYSKCYQEKSFDEIYSLLEKMAKDSYASQEQRKFEGNLKSDKLMLSRAKAKNLFFTNRKDLQENEIGE